MLAHEQRKILASHHFKGQRVPTYMQDGLIAYLQDGRRPGEFLLAVLRGDLFGAYQYADDANLQNIGAYVSFLYNHADPRCFGSKEKVTKWLDSRSTTRYIPSTSVTGDESNG